MGLQTMCFEVCQVWAWTRRLRRPIYQSCPLQLRWKLMNTLRCTPKAFLEGLFASFSTRALIALSMMWCDLSRSWKATEIIRNRLRIEYGPRFTCTCYLVQFPSRVGYAHLSICRAMDFRLRPHTRRTALRPGQPSGDSSFSSNVPETGN